MKLSILFSVLPAVYSFCHTPPAVEIDIKAYSGKWYEIAATWTVHKLIERNCICTEANYSLMEEDPTDISFMPRIKVVNTCFKNGAQTVATAVATMNDRPGNSLIINHSGDFTVTFDKNGNQGRYIVSKIFGNYDQALVTSTCGALIWILARTREIPQERYDEIVSYARGIRLHTHLWALKKSVQCGLYRPNN